MKKIAALGLCLQFVAALAFGQGPTRLDRISVNNSGTQANGNSAYPAISANARYVAYTSDATNIAANDTNNRGDVFVYDRALATVEIVSRFPGDIQPNAHCFFDPHGISSDGQYVTYVNPATNWPGGNASGFKQVYLYDRVAHETTLVSRTAAGQAANGDSTQARMSNDGRFVVYLSAATDIVNISGDTSDADVFLYDRELGTTECISLDGNGDSPDGWASYASVTSDGRYIAFTSDCDALTANDNNQLEDAYVKDRQTGALAVITKSAAGGASNGVTYDCVISGDGQFACLNSKATNLETSGLATGIHNIFLWSRQSDAIQLISKGFGGAAPDNYSMYCSISSDGRIVLFMSLATNLTSTPQTQVQGTYIYNNETGELTRASQTLDSTEANGLSFHGSVSADGNTVAFMAYATNLVANDTNNSNDIFVLGPRYTSFGITAMKGLVRNDSKSGRDIIKFSGRMEMSDANDEPSFNPATDAFALSLESDGGGYAIQIDAGDPGWKSLKGGRYSWRSPKGALEKINIQINTLKRTLNIQASGFDFDAAPSNPLHFTLQFGADAGERVDAWRTTLKTPWIFKNP